MDEQSPTPSDAAKTATHGDRLDESVLLDTVSDGVYQLDRDGHIVAANDALAEIVGYNRETLLGTHAAAFLDSEDVIRGQTAARKLPRDGSKSIRLDIPIFTADSEIIPCEVSMRPIVQEGIYRGVAGVVRTIEDRENATTVQDAGERRQAFDALADASADGIIMLDDNSDIRYANPAVERILGYSREELVGSPKMKIIPERLRQTHMDALERYLESGEKHIDWTYVELPGLHKEGHEVPLAISLNEFEHDGEHYFVGTFRDISKRKEAERELKRQNERLDQFASMLAHELRNPLTVADGYLELVEGNEEAVDRIAKNLERIDEIIDVLLVLARGRDEVIAGETADLAAVASEAWNSIDIDGASLDVNTSQVLHANAMHLHNVLENLFRNAAENSDGPVTVSLGALNDGFYVADDGPGIPAAEREKVTNAGYTTGEDGIGLGLTFVTQLADAYGWEWAITAGEDGGARFEFTSVETVGE